jgi:hypothetical protein
MGIRQYAIQACASGVRTVRAEGLQMTSRASATADVSVRRPGRGDLTGVAWPVYALRRVVAGWGTRPRLYLEPPPLITNELSITEPPNYQINKKVALRIYVQNGNIDRWRNRWSRCSAP